MLKEAGVVSVDIVSLFTLKLLNLLDLLPRFFAEVHVATSVFEAIRSEIEQIESVKPGEGILGYEAERLTLIDTPADYHQKRIAFLEEILDFLSSEKVNLSGLQAAIWEDPKTQQLVQALGSEFTHPIAVAKGTSATLYTDDVVLRNFARSEFGVAGFSTQSLLRVAEERGLISSDEYEDSVLKLVEHNYVFIYDTARTILHALKKQNYVCDGLGEKLLWRITDPNVNRDGAAAVLGESLAAIWYGVREPERDQLVRSVVKPLSTLADFGKVAQRALVQAGAMMLQTPAAFFGLTASIARSEHFSPKQKKILRTLSLLIARSLWSFSRDEHPFQTRLHGEWFEHIQVALRREVWVDQLEEATC